MRTTFAVGRLTSSAAEIVLLEDETHPSFPGPWTLRAVVRRRVSEEAPPAGSDRRSRRSRPGGSTIPSPGGDGTVH